MFLSVTIDGLFLRARSPTVKCTVSGKRIVKAIDRAIPIIAHAQQRVVFE